MYARKYNYDTVSEIQPTRSRKRRLRQKRKSRIFKLIVGLGLAIMSIAAMIYVGGEDSGGLLVGVIIGLWFAFSKMEVYFE